MSQPAGPTPFKPKANSDWAIGIYSGPKPWQLSPHSGAPGPVLDASHVTDVRAMFVADPFMQRTDDTWYMFFEVLNLDRGLGEIGLATSGDGLRWDYHSIVLREDYHLSYPYVFRLGDDYYMVPETVSTGLVQIYKAAAFPFDWQLAGTLLETPVADASPFHFDGRWWMFVCATPFTQDSLDLYVADELFGKWKAHPANPILAGDRSRSRPCGRVVICDSKPVRFSQDCVPNYGTMVRAFEVNELTPSSYSEQEIATSPILKPTGTGWNSSRMHHVDAHQQEDGSWIACVDGDSKIGKKHDTHVR